MDLESEYWNCVLEYEEEFKENTPTSYTP